MYIPLNTSTIATALATAIANPTPVPSGPGVGPGPSSPHTNDLATPFSMTTVLSEATPPRVNYPFPEFPDQDAFRLGEEPLTTCIRDAVEDAGNERYAELTTNHGWKNFLIKSRDEGLVGVDTNIDGNTVEGLLDWVRMMADKDNPDLDPEIYDIGKCARLVKRFTSQGLLDEVLLNWAERTGLIRDLPPTRPSPKRPPPEKRGIVYDVVLDNDHRSELKIVDGVIGYVPKDNDTSDPSKRPVWINVDNGAIVYTPGTKYNWPNVTDHAKSQAPYNNSTLRARSTHLGALRLSSVPDNSTGHGSHLFPGRVGLRVGPVIWNFTIPGNSTFPWNLTVTGNSTHRGHAIFRDVLLGNVTVHHSLDSKFDLYNSTTTSNTSIPEPRKAISEENIIQYLKVTFLQDPEVRWASENSADLTNKVSV